MRMSASPQKQPSNIQKNSTESSLNGIGRKKLRVRRIYIGYLTNKWYLTNKLSI